MIIIMLNVYRVAPDDLEETKGFLDDFSSGYVRRAASITVKQGNKKP